MFDCRDGLLEPQRIKWAYKSRCAQLTRFGVEMTAGDRLQKLEQTVESLGRKVVELEVVQEVRSNVDWVIIIKTDGHFRVAASIWILYRQNAVQSGS